MMESLITNFFLPVCLGLATYVLTLAAVRLTMMIVEDIKKETSK